MQFPVCATLIRCLQNLQAQRLLPTPCYHLDVQWKRWRVRPTTCDLSSRRPLPSCSNKTLAISSKWNFDDQSFTSLVCFYNHLHTPLLRNHSYPFSPSKYLTGCYGFPWVFDNELANDSWCGFILNDFYPFFKKANLHGTSKHPFYHMGLIEPLYPPNIQDNVPL